MIGRLTLPRLAALKAEWRRRPPLRDIVAAYLGIEGEPEPAAIAANPADQNAAAFEALMGFAPP